jgi:membrane protease YdiL (CAAX protease family)
VPAILLSCAAVGYTEELYFRVYLLKRLGEAGLAPFWAATVSVLLFASAHGLQGALGLLLASLIGAWLCFRRFRGASLHELAWAHALYDAGVMIAALYAAA